MKVFIVTLLCITPLLSFSQDSLANHYKLYDSAAQKPATVDDVVNSMDKADVLFFGEEHSDSTDHYLELILLKKLAAKYPGKVALSMEMFETDCQNTLNEYLDGFIRERNFINEARAWKNYEDYRPLIEFAKANHIPVIAANAPARYVNMVNRLGLASLEQLNKQSKSYLPPLPIDTATGVYYDKFLQAMGGHAPGGMQMFQAQNLWDATMAWSIVLFARKHDNYKILQLNGSFHSEEKLGAVAQLKKYRPKIRIENVATCDDDNYDNPNWAGLAKNGDYILITDPKVPKTF